MRYWNKRTDSFRCPYYISENPAEITCEGVAASSKKTVTRFNSESDKFKWQESQCCAYPNACPIAMGNDDKY